MSVLAKADVYTMDLSNPSNPPSSFLFNESGMWAETYNETEYGYIETQIFGFEHLPSKNSYGGTSWVGFTVSRATQDGDDAQFQWYSNVAKGGRKSIGAPYIYGYYSEHWTLYDDTNNPDMQTSNRIIFNDGNAYYPRYVYVNNALYSYRNVLEGGGMARAFQKGDKYILRIQGLDASFEHDITEPADVEYLLADFTSDNEDEWFVNTEWAKVDLSAIDHPVYGLAFWLVSTDQSCYGYECYTNTATYFALDGLTVSTTADEVIPTKVATFENEAFSVNLTTPESHWYGNDDVSLIGWKRWMSGDYTFKTYTASGYNSAFVVTNETSTDFFDYNDALRSASGGAYDGTNYAVWNACYYGADTVTFDKRVVPGFFVNNTAYTVSSMNNGDEFAKYFQKEDYLELQCIGLLNNTVVDTITVDLAKDGEYIANWTYVDLSSLGEIDAITFRMDGNDQGFFGLNTPAYFAVDNFGAEMPGGYVEPAKKKFLAVAGFENETGGINLTTAESNWFGADAPADGWNNWTSGDFNFQTYAKPSWDYYSAFVVSNETSTEFTDFHDAWRSAAGGAFEGDNFAGWNLNYYGVDTMAFDKQVIRGFYVNNSAYTVNSMKNGDGYCEKYDNDDYFTLECIGLDGKAEVGRVSIDLAKEGKYMNQWTYVDLSTIGEINGLTFSFITSDAGTPSYFCMDNFGAPKPYDYVAPEMTPFPGSGSAIDNIETSAPAVKFIQNGQLYILRDGKVYNVTGAVVK